MRAEHASVKKGAHAIIWRCFAISSATSWWPVNMRCPVEKLEAYRTCSDSFGLACPAFAFCDLTRGFLLSNRVVHSRLNRFLGVIYLCRLAPTGFRCAHFFINSNSLGAFGLLGGCELVSDCSPCQLSCLYIPDCWNFPETNFHPLLGFLRNDGRMKGFEQVNVCWLCAFTFLPAAVLENQTRQYPEPGLLKRRYRNAPSSLGAPLSWP